MYSWGNDINATRANYLVSGLSQTRDVGYYAANPWGFFDMNGNVWEWTADRNGTYPATQVNDPQGGISSSFRVIRGGSWNNGWSHLRSAKRNFHKSSLRNDGIGFRYEVPKQKGLDAKQRLMDLLPKQFEVTTILNKRGKYGRILGTIKIRDEKNNEIVALI